MYKKDDIVVCLPGFDTSDHSSNKGGAGWEEGRIYQVDHVTGYILRFSHPKDFKGVWKQSVRLATEHEQKYYKEGVRYLKDVPIPESIITDYNIF